MSIASSAVVRPSRCVRLLHAGFCCCVIASAAWCEGRAGIALCVVAGLAGLIFVVKKTKPRRIDIVDVGTVRLAVYQQSGDAGAAVPVSLLGGSTLWPWLLVLRLGLAGGRVATLLVLPDSTAAVSFRLLALACRAIAARGGEIKKSGDA